MIYEFESHTFLYYALFSLYMILIVALFFAVSSRFDKFFSRIGDGEAMVIGVMIGTLAILLWSYCFG